MSIDLRDTSASAEPDLEQRFNALLAGWSADMALESSIQKIAMHPSYQRIIGMGPQVLPLIFATLYRYKILWFWALNAITGEDPVPEGAYGGDAVGAWAAWARQRGYSVDDGA